jgi:hypothetical protein
MDEIWHGLTFCDPSQQQQYFTTAKMFIDTDDFLAWLHESPTAITVTYMLQHDAQAWERLLWTSGLCYVIYWQVDLEGRATMTSKTDLPTPLRFTSGPDPIREPVRQHNCDEAHTYLGDTLASDLQMKTTDVVLMN